ncbi:glycosyltransferase family 28 C-terminal domain-containing protein [Roridomyces roridus]|uniref:UDP-N-acetylglucosamine transferase subunit ALG13 n=1 Tax=Roridomyces roridus TaxID=1738132 RepID=A0AAD7BWJ3_9AGAR|nr:glycosyltransferase family 28 C-terminal domain-containing protein [Roridomyces roridus]
MLCFVTVGTFSFDLLVRAVLSEPVLDALQARGYTRLVIQYGDSEFDTSVVTRTGLDIELWARKPSLDQDFRRADLVIGHAGAGTILDPLIVVPNESLLHNHQLELATALAASNHLRTSTIADLAHSVTVFDPAALATFEPFDGSRFRALVDEEMGFQL